MAKKPPLNPSHEAPVVDADAQVADEQKLQAAVNILFGTEDHPIELRDGSRVVVRNGKLKDVGLLLSFFNSLLRNLDRAQFVALVDVLELDAKRKLNAQQEMQRMRAALESGVPYTPPEVPSTEELVNQTFDKAQLFISVATAAADVLPNIIRSLTDLPADRVEDLDLDEAAALSVAIFQVNYSFFSRNLPQVLRPFLAGAANRFRVKV